MTRRSRAAIVSSVLLALVAAHAGAQTLLPQDRRISRDLDTRPLDQRTAPGAEDGFQQPLTDEAIDPSLNDLPEAEPVEPERPVEPEAAEEVLPFDIFEDRPGPGMSERQNLPGEALDGGLIRPQGALIDPLARPSETADTADPPAAALRPPLSYDMMAPVRSPAATQLGAQDRLNIAAGGGRRILPLVEDDPFAPLGIHAGRFILYPVLEQGFGASDNVTADPSETAGGFSQTTLSTRLLSDWSRHEAEVNASLGYRRNFEGSPEEEPSFRADGRVRLDISRDLTGLLRGAVAFSREDPILADNLTPASERPEILSFSGGAELERRVGRSLLTISGDALREERDSMGGAARDDFSTYTLGLRAGYEIAPLFQPFASASIGRRTFDDELGASGLERDSLISALRLGIAFDRGEKFFGEAAVGYAWNDPDATGLETRGSPTIDATINWSPRRGTELFLQASTFFDPDFENAGASTVYDAALGIRHRATARAEFSGQLSATYRAEEGVGADETTYAAEAGITYWLNRNLALIGTVRHQRLESEEAQAEYSANSILVGVRAQR